jgi:phospholipid transport system substrate-binding protein
MLPSFVLKSRPMPVLALAFAMLMAIASPVLFAPPAGAATAPAGTAAERFVQQNIDRGYAILRDAKITEMMRQDMFREFALGIMDERRIGVFTLGRYANGASKTDLDAFVAAFADFTAAVYETRLMKYKNHVLAVTGSQARADDDVIVNCTATDPTRSDRPPFKVAFRVRKEGDGSLTVTDMNIEGIWQTLTHRADFTAFLQQHGGRLADLIGDLKQQTRTIYASA